MFISDFIKQQVETGKYHKTLANELNISNGMITRLKNDINRKPNIIVCSIIYKKYGIVIYPYSKTMLDNYIKSEV